MYLLENQESQQIRQKVVNDTCSLRDTISGTSSAPSTSIADSSVREQDVRKEDLIRIWGHEVSRAATLMYPAEGASNPTNEIGEMVASDIGVALSAPDVEEIPTLRYESRVHERSRLDTMSVASDSIIAYGQRCRAALKNHKRSSAPSPLSPRYETYIEGPTVRRKTLEADRKPFWSTLLGKRSSRTKTARAENDASAEAVKGLAVTPMTYHARKLKERRVRSSINLDSAEDLAVPAIVRAAQSGSILEVEILLAEGVDVEQIHAPSGRNALAVASHCGNETIVRLLLEHGVNLDLQDLSLMTPLHLAASRGHYVVVQLLIQEGASVDQLGPNNATPLRIACDNGCIEVADRLLCRRAKINARDSDHVTALHAAAKRGDEAMVNFIVEKGGDVEARDSCCMAALHYAAESGHNNIVKALLNRKANIHALGESSISALACASAAGQVHIVELLLSKKADIKQKGEGGMTSLHWAAFKGHVDVVELLIRKRADIDARSTELLTPLHLAIQASQFAVVELLLRSNAKIEALSRSSLRPLHYACVEGTYAIVNLLLESCANIEAEDENGRRPLHHVASRSDPEILGLLLEGGSSIEARDKAGNRALCIASSEGDLAAVRLLLEHGAALTLEHVSQGVSYDDSPLCIAAKMGHTAVVMELISKGSSVLQKDRNGWQPLRHAAYHDHPKVVELLLKHGATVSGTSLDTWRFGLSGDLIIPEQGLLSAAKRKTLAFRLLSDAEEREQAQRIGSRHRLQQFIENTSLAETTHTLPSELSRGWEGISLPVLTDRCSGENVKGRPPSSESCAQPNNLVDSCRNTRSDQGNLAISPSATTASRTSAPPISALQEHSRPPMNPGTKSLRRKSYADLTKAVRKSYGECVLPLHPKLALDVPHMTTFLPQQRV